MYACEEWLVLVCTGGKEAARHARNDIKRAAKNSNRPRAAKIVAENDSFRTICVRTTSNCKPAAIFISAKNARHDDVINVNNRIGGSRTDMYTHTSYSPLFIFASSFFPITIFFATILLHSFGYLTTLIYS